ncbi:hypothetical protein D3C87_175570 [compost metagenome]
MDTVWKEYKLRKSVFWMSVFIFFVWMWFCSSFVEMLFLGFIIGVAIVGAAAVFYARWKCPRCHKPFVLKGAYGNVLTTKCLHCGLPSYASSAEISNLAYNLKA